jgi:hypothetical protein
VYLSAKFISATAVLPADVFSGAAQAKALLLKAEKGLLDNQPASVHSAEEAGNGSSSRYLLRFLVMPATSQTFHLSDAFFNRFPALNE